MMISSITPNELATEMINPNLQAMASACPRMQNRNRNRKKNYQAVHLKEVWEGL